MSNWTSNTWEHLNSRAASLYVSQNNVNLNRVTNDSINRRGRYEANWSSTRTGIYCNVKEIGGGSK